MSVSYTHLITNIGYIYTVSFPGGIAIDKAGNIAFCDQINLVVDTRCV